jgi:hypothetical protein
MLTYTPEELRSQHPKRFEKEYERWREYAADWDWHEWAEDEIKADMKAHGIEVDRFLWSGFYSQGDGAAFEGRVNLADWMRVTKSNEEQTFAEKYPALYLACKQDGSYASVRNANRGFYMYVNTEESLWGTEPCGIFSQLDKDAWDELVNDQYNCAALEEEVRTTCERFMSDFYNTLRDEYENITSEDAFVASCEANDITFEIEGEECEV